MFLWLPYINLGSQFVGFEISNGTNVQRNVGESAIANPPQGFFLVFMDFRQTNRKLWEWQFSRHNMSNSADMACNCLGA
jgi:hypothetical protein